MTGGRHRHRRHGAIGVDPDDARFDCLRHTQRPGAVTGKYSGRQTVFSLVRESNYLGFVPESYDTQYRAEKLSIDYAQILPGTGDDSWLVK